jgi:DNA-binding NarL/FixJ family response regulator
VQAVIETYETGVTSIELAGLYGVSKSALLGLLHAQGLAQRKHALTPEQVQQARLLRQQGLSYAAIGEQLGFYASTVSRALHTVS